MSKIKEFLNKEKCENHTVYNIQDSDLNGALPDLFAVNGDVKLHEHVDEVNGVKQILYDATLFCTTEQFVELRVRLGVKGLNTKTNKPKEECQ